jgi:cysteine desulfurase
VDRSYFDHNATTPLSPEVLEVYVRALRETFGNASSIHWFGQEAKRRLERARGQVAALLGCPAKDVVFLSGGTEANNLALLGAVRACRRERRHVITSQIEHPSVLRACRQLEREGAEVTYLPVSGCGLVDPDLVRRALRPHTVLISVMHVNNEIGVIEPAAEIAAIAREAGVLFHSDGVQAAGKIRLDEAGPPADLYTLSGHKLYAPKGVGALYVRRGIALEPLLYGGRQERDWRPGTLNAPGAVALGAAAETAARALEGETRRLAALRDRLEQSLLERVPGCGINGWGAPRVANTTNLYFDGVSAEALLIALDLKGFAVSTGSACSSGAVEPSHVLMALGLSPERARASLRFSLGRGNTAEQVEALVAAVAEAVAHLRKLSPVAVHAG